MFLLQNPPPFGVVSEYYNNKLVKIDTKCMTDTSCYEIDSREHKGFTYYCPLYFQYLNLSIFSGDMFVHTEIIL